MAGVKNKVGLANIAYSSRGIRAFSPGGADPPKRVSISRWTGEGAATQICHGHPGHAGARAGRPWHRIAASPLIARPKSSSRRLEFTILPYRGHGVSLCSLCERFSCRRDHGDNRRAQGLPPPVLLACDTSQTVMRPVAALSFTRQTGAMTAAPLDVTGYNRGAQFGSHLEAE